MTKLAAVCVCALALACGANPETAGEQPSGDVAPVAYPQDVIEAEPERLPPLSVCLYDVTESDDVLAGVAGWAEALRPWRDIVIGDRDCNVTIFEVGQHAALCASDDAAGCTTQIGGLEESDPSLDVFLYRGNYETFAAGAVMHEIGHLLGLTHAEEGLMRADMDRGSDWVTPDAVTLERLSRLLRVDL
jgi:hypothetical protein